MGHRWRCVLYLIETPRDQIGHNVLLRPVEGAGSLVQPSRLIRGDSDVQRHTGVGHESIIANSYTAISITGEQPTTPVDEKGGSMPRLTVGSERGVPIQLHYNDHGSGRPVVLVHGWPLSGRMWEQQVLVLAEAGYRVVTYDRRGFGGSSQPWEGHDYDTFASDLGCLIDELDLDDATLVGFSMGGGEVARYLGTYGKHRVRQAVLLAAATPFLLHTDDNPEGGMTAATIADREADLQTDRLGFLDGLTTMFFSTPDQGLLVSEATRLYYRDIAAFASPWATVRCLHAFATTDFRGDLATFDLPTLVVHGDSDSNVPLDVTSRRTHEMVKGSELVVVPGAPHGLAVTHSKEVNEILLGFLAR